MIPLLNTVIPYVLLAPLIGLAVMLIHILLDIVTRNQD